MAEPLQISSPLVVQKMLKNVMRFILATPPQSITFYFFQVAEAAQREYEKQKGQIPMNPNNPGKGFKKCQIPMNPSNPGKGCQKLRV